MKIAAGKHNLYPKVVDLCTNSLKLKVRETNLQLKTSILMLLIPNEINKKKQW